MYVNNYEVCHKYIFGLFSPLTILETPAETLQVPVVDIEHDPLHDQASERDD